MTQTKTFVDAEGPVRAWLRGQSIEGVSNRVFLSLPERTAFPAVEIVPIGGAIVEGEAPLADVAFQFSCWGGTRVQAIAAAWSLCSKLESMSAHTTLDATLQGCGARVTLIPTFRPDPDGKPRYIVEATIAVKVPA